MVEVTIAPDAEPGEREIRLVTLRGVSNPLAFHVGQVPEVSRKPMLTAAQQVLGKEAQALRKRPPDDGEEPHHRALHRQRPDRFRRSEPLPVRGAARASAW